MPVDYSNPKLIYCRKLNSTNQEAMIDKNESPDGFYPIPKDSLNHTNENVCHFCDWRKECDARICSCMSYSRADGIGVFFKKKSGG